MWQAFKRLRAKVRRWEPVAFFLLGFAFDALALHRIDSRFSLLHQAVYLALLGCLLVVDHSFGEKLAGRPGLIAKVWSFREDLIHFLFGTLLNVYTLFYFRSASGLLHAAFFAVVVGFLLANELPRFRRLGFLFRLALYSFCLTSYFAYLFPVLAGFLSPWLFVLASLASLIPLGALLWQVARWGGGLEARRGAWAGGAVQTLLVGLYFLHAIPPVPLSVKQIGVYHQVERDELKWRLSYLPTWKWWSRGDERFLARPGDKIHVFVRIFAPTNFRDRVSIRWSYREPERGWVPSDAIPLAIFGGREEGFRGHAFKSNFQPGDWKVEVISDDGRRVGSLNFSVEADPSEEPREFAVEDG